MTVPGNLSSPLLATAAGGGAAAAFTLEKSVRFNSVDTTFLSRTPSSASSRKTWTWAAWVKLSKPSSDYDRFFGSEIAVNTITTIRITQLSGQQDRLEFHHNDGTNTSNVTTDAKLRDVSAWYHIVVAVDTTQATAANRTKIYINGVEQSLSVSNYLNQNVDTYINSTNTHNVGRSQQYGSYFNGYMADVYFIDGQQLDPTSFGAFDSNGVWQAKDASDLTFGTNGFHLFDFANESGIGNDSSGNNNDFTVNNISSSAGAGNDVLRDVPTNGDASDDTGAGGEVSGNYCTLNPLTAFNFTLTQGNLTGASTGSAGGGVAATMGVSSGKWYWELSPTSLGSTFMYVGVFSGDKLSNPAGTIDYPSSSSAGSNSFGFRANGSKRSNGSETSYGNSWGVGDVVGIAVDMDNGKIWFSVNGTFQASGNPAAGTNAAYTTLSGTVVPGIGDADASANATFDMNFGARSFAYSAPSGFKALCTTNLPTPTIADGSEYFNAIAYAGDGVSGRTITTTLNTVGLAWVKRRNGADNHRLSSVVLADNRFLGPNSNSAEQTSSGQIQSFSSNTFDIGNDTAVNSTSNTYCAWAWDAGTSNASNTDGTITSTVRANIAAGFSVVTYTGNGTYNSQIGHGLGVSPHVLIVKSRSTTGDWAVYTRATGSQKYFLLNSTAAPATDSSYWAYNTPETSVFRVGANANVNTNGTTYLALCFAPVAGYSAFGTYTGSSDGEFIYTGFRPALVAARRYDSSGTWVVCDSARDPSNAVVPFLSWNSSGAEVNSADRFDFLSNGFKLRAPSNFNPNESGADYLYFAFAENPFQANGGLAR